MTDTEPQIADGKVLWHFRCPWTASSPGRITSSTG